MDTVDYTDTDHDVTLLKQIYLKGAAKMGAPYRKINEEEESLSEGNLSNSLEDVEEFPENSNRKTEKISQ